MSLTFPEAATWFGIIVAAGLFHDLVSWAVGRARGRARRRAELLLGSRRR